MKIFPAFIDNPNNMTENWYKKP